MNLRDFGTEQFPLRASSLPNLIRCPHAMVLQTLSILERTGSKAADTGSAVHAGIDSWHRSGEVQTAIAEMRKRLGEFPSADLHEAELSLLPYTRDPRNKKEAVIQSEVKVVLVLETSEKEVYITGRCDQVRDDGRLWDIKHSERPGFELTHEYSYQLAAYAKALGIQVGGVINPKAYRKRTVKEADPPGVFFPTLWEQKNIDVLMDEVVRVVLDIRYGRVPIRPGSYCSYCPAGSFRDCVELEYSS